MVFSLNETKTNQWPKIVTFYCCYSSDLADARRNKVKEARKRREQRIAEKREDLMKSYTDDDSKK